MTVTLFAVFATAAFAASDFWFSGGLPSGSGFASTAAHSINYIQGSGNLNGFCVAKDQGISGYDTAWRNVGTRACATSGGFASRSENSACCYHGWVDNQTGSTITLNGATRYDY
jgi:hypothetical protein